MNLRRSIDLDDLRQRYLIERRTMDELAAHYGCGATTIRRRLSELGIPTRARGPRQDPGRQFEWTPDLAYAVGLITTDGNLSSDGRHLTVTSADKQLLTTLRLCLRLNASITRQAGTGRACYRVAWGDRQLYRWLLTLGLLPAKSRRLGELAIPDRYFADFARGCIDGDGSIVVYTDRYNTFKSEKYVYTRLVISITSASLNFLEWFQSTAGRLSGAKGGVYVRKSGWSDLPYWVLKFTKRDSIRLSRWIYYAPDVSCLERKRQVAVRYLADA